MISAHRRLLTTLFSAFVVLGMSFSGLATPAAQAADTGSITGVVKAKPLGGTAAAMEFANVYAYEQLPSGFTGRTFSATTDDQGRYSVTGLPEGDYEVRIIPSGGSGSPYAEEYYDNAWAYGTPKLVTVGSTTSTLGDVVLEPVAWVTGRVTDANGHPLPETWVYVGGPGGGGVGVKTDATGYYDSRDDYWGRLVPGTYDISSSGPANHESAEDPVYRYVEQPANVAAGAGSTVNLVLEQLKTTVFTVKDAGGAPVTSAPVELRIQSVPGGPFDLPQYGPIMTDERGQFRVDSHANGYQLRFHPDPDSSTGAVPEWWDGGQGAATYGAAAAVTWTAASPMKTSHAVTLGPLTGPTPTITGTPRVGQTLTANPGTWSPAGPALSYQWLAGGQPIAGATSKTLALTSAQVGKAISVRVTGTVDSVSTPKTSAATAAVAALLVAGTPTITGTARVGQTLTANPGTWAPGTAALSYQWLAGGQEIAGATSSTLALTAAQVGKTISVRVTGTHAGQTASKTSAATNAVVELLVPATPTVSGIARAGQTLTANPGAWAPGAAALSYQWLADGEPIAGATAPTLELTTDHLGHAISVKVTGTHVDQTAERISAATTAVVDILVAAKPTVTGAARVGQRLTANPGAWPTGTEFTYQWLVDGKPVAGATGSSLLLTSSHAGRRVTVEVTGTAGDEQATGASAATAPVVGLLTRAVPTVKGKAVVGKKLKAKPGAWGPAPVVVTYTWLRNGKVIKGARAATYKLTKKDAGKRIQVRVTVSKVHYLPVVATSKKTAKVKR